MPTNNQRHPMLSKTNLSGVVATLPAILPLLGVGADDVTLISQGVDQLISLAGLLGIFWGRQKAGGLKKWF